MDKKPAAYPVLETPVMIDLFADGVERPLRYTLRSMQNLKKLLGRPLMAIGRGVGGMFLLDVDEDMLPQLIFEGLRSDDGHGNVIEPDVTLDQILGVPSSAYPYFLTQFSTAYMQALPAAKKKEHELMTEVAPETPAPPVN